MLEIDRTLVSLEVLSRKFCCNLQACKGSCCVHGDAGAPLTIEETGYLDDYMDELRPYLSTDGIMALVEEGMYMRDIDGELVTTLIRGGECAYTVFEDGISFCAIEKAFHAGDIPFNKPVSCHLYPIRIKSYDDFDAINFDEWDICKPALPEGERQGLPVYQFVREALIRKYGTEWYDQLDYAASNLDLKKLVPEE
ncbi:MAG: hypothetical protein A2X22_10335 [Bacteroidetes bacterium GWF2_49_14]|nr:MAG: hypothetical protein A2X22_10335 [Bacteroidetes bacterium GWF2_49_14]HBB93671.1 DUF3109 domain-containing protein [Bacteroidales bacterium]